ncbi:MAG: NADPH-dependent FMN reductase [Vicingaceae bacterium]
MTTIISASNREGNLTALFAQECLQFFEAAGEDCQLFYLDELPSPLSLQSVYEYKTSAFADLSEKLIQPADKLLFVVPEYNGSIPGILKLFLDAIEPPYFKGKKAALIGISAGRAGNLRGMDHLTDILHYLQVNVMPFKLPISRLFDLIENDRVVDEETLSLMKKQVDDLIAF